MLSTNSESTNNQSSETGFLVENNLDDNQPNQAIPPQKRNFWQKISPFQADRKIRTQLLMTVLPTVLTPLVIISGISYWIVHEELEHELEDKIENQAVLARNNDNESVINYLQQSGITDTQTIQIVNLENGTVTRNITKDDNTTNQTIVGGETVLNLARDLVTSQQNRLNNTSDENNAVDAQIIAEKYDGINELDLSSINSSANQANQNDNGLIAEFAYLDKRYYIATNPNTPFVSISSIDEAQLQTQGGELISILLVITTILALLITTTIFYLSNQLSKPFTQLANNAREVSAGNLDKVSEVGGNLEAVTLNNNFNNLVSQVRLLLEEQKSTLQQVEIAKQEAENLATEQTKQREVIQNDLLSLLSDVEGVSGGDLTVRAKISDGEIGIVADFFNSIVESLRELVTQVKQTTIKVNKSLINDEEEIAQLARESINQSQKIQQMLESVETMTRSIRQVAQNTQSAAKVAQLASNTAKTGEVTIDKTVQSIVELRETVGETAKKVKRLGESSQQISKVISLINQIALQTNLLAINASIEAARAGEEGRGFAVVAEEVGQLAAQSAVATKEIEQIVEAIQKETSSVVQAMEDGTTQVVKSTKLVEEAKKGFGEITLVSGEINQLLKSISGATVSQTKTSTEVANLMKEIAQIAQISSNSSTEVANSLIDTVDKARQLQSSVETFKVS